MMRLLVCPMLGPKAFPEGDSGFDTYLGLL
jgi:hypothetical protein